MKVINLKQLTSSIFVLGIILLGACSTNDKDLKATFAAGFNEKKVILSNGVSINYAEGPGHRQKALLLIHGQMGAWQDYKKVLPELSKNWHVFAVDCLGHGKSSHDPTRYYLDSIGNDLSRFIAEVIKEKTVVTGHSSGGLIAAYLAGGQNPYIVGSLLEDPPVFSTEKEYFPKTFVYHDDYKVIHDFLTHEPKECWEAYYLRNCYWGKLYIPDKITKIADDARKYHEKHPGKPIQIWYLPKSLNERLFGMFLYIQDYDLRFGDKFFDYTWHHGISHENLMRNINVSTVFMHAKDAYALDPVTKDSILMAASSNQQAQKAVSLIKNCELFELVSGHDIHLEKPEIFIENINKLINR